MAANINLTVDLQDMSGVELGSVSNPAYVRIALCNYGSQLPRVAGTSMIAKVGPFDTPYVGAPITIPLYGNDQITPGGTYYAISVLDDKKNVLQTSAYILTGTGTFLLSSLTPQFPASAPSVLGGLVPMTFSATPVFDCSLVHGPIVFDITLSANVTSSTLKNTYPGQIVMFSIRQNGTGGFTFVWPSNVNNAGVVSPDPNSVTSQAFWADASGNLYPLGPQTYS